MQALQADKSKTGRKPEPMKRKFDVATDTGVYPTWATSPKKAISNVRFRVFGTRPGVNTTYWTVTMVG